MKLWLWLAARRFQFLALRGFRPAGCLRRYHERLPVNLSYMYTVRALQEHARFLVNQALYMGSVYLTGMRSLTWLGRWGGGHSLRNRLRPNDELNDRRPRLVLILRGFEHPLRHASCGGAPAECAELEGAQLSPENFSGVHLFCEDQLDEGALGVIVILCCLNLLRSGSRCARARAQSPKPHSGELHLEG